MLCEYFVRIYCSRNLWHSINISIDRAHRTPKKLKNINCYHERVDYRVHALESYSVT